MLSRETFTKKEYTIKEVAKLLSVTAPTIRNWGESGKLEIKKDGRWVVERDELLRFLEDNDLMDTKESVYALCLGMHGKKDFGAYKNLLDVMMFMRENLEIEGEEIKTFKLFFFDLDDIEKAKETFDDLLLRVRDRDISGIYYIDKSIFPIKEFIMFDTLCEVLGVHILKLDIDLSYVDSFSMKNESENHYQTVAV